jgi:hypothetical protein
MRLAFGIHERLVRADISGATMMGWVGMSSSSSGIGTVCQKVAFGSDSCV